MKKLELRPTPDNLRNTFINDSIGRNKDLFNFISIIDSLEECYSIALDSYWGSGKTFFVKQIKMILDAITEESYTKVDGKDQVLSKWRSLSSNANLKNHIAIYYDAWQNDCDDDPLYSLIYQMMYDTKYKKGIKEKINPSDIISVFGKITEAVSGIDPNEMAESLKKDGFLKEIEDRINMEKRINEYISKLLPIGCDRLLIVIDELDRCNPEFAVKLLERIKHYFTNDNVTFIFSVNLVELQHTIAKFYGSDFDTSRYLDRFFDLRINLPKPNLNNYLSNTYGIYNNTDIYNSMIKLIIKEFDLQLREIAKYVQITKALSCKGCDINHPFYYSQSIIFYAFIPIMAALLLTDYKKYCDLKNGSDISPLTDFYNNEERIDNLHYIFKTLYDDTEMDSFRTTEMLIQNIELFKERLNQFYNALFNTSNQEKNVGKCIIRETDRSFFRNAISLLDKNVINNLNNSCSNDN